MCFKMDNVDLRGRYRILPCEERLRVHCRFVFRVKMIEQDKMNGRKDVDIDNFSTS